MNSAYEVVGDKEKRAQFDRGEIDAEGKPRFQGFEGFGGGRGGARPADFADSLWRRRSPFGGRRRAGLRRRSGRGHLFSALRRSVPLGRGEGSDRAEPAAEGRRRRAATLTVTLRKWRGGQEAPRLSTGREVDVVIPKGVADGQVIRLRGAGPGRSRRSRRCLLTIKLRPMSGSRRDRLDLRLSLPISIEAASSPRRTTRRGSRPHGSRIGGTTSSARPSPPT